MSVGVAFRLDALAERVGVELRGDGACKITHVDTIQEASAGAICFLANAKYRKYLADSQTSAVILAADDLAEANGLNALVCENPYLIYARVARLLYPDPAVVGGIHPSAVVADSAVVDGSASIGPCAVVEENADIGPGVLVGPGCIVGQDCVIGCDSRLIARVTLGPSTRVGERVRIHPGAVIGSDGFGNANDQGVWEKVPQLGRVLLGDDVEIGANTTIDRGALRDTVIGNGVRLDNQIQIAHNVKIGEHTAIAGCVGIAGSTTVGRYCTLGGGVGLSGHLEIGDNVHFSGQTLVTRSIKEPGYYSGNLPAVTNGEWRKTVARIRRLDASMKQLRALEKRVSKLCEEESSDSE